MKQKDTSFDEKLELGQQGEDQVYNYLITKYGYVEDTRKQRYEDNVGPRLRGTDGYLVLPDFVVYDTRPGGAKFAVDVKVKNSIYTVNNRNCFTVDYKYEHYKRVAEVKGLDFVAIIFVYKGTMFFYRDSDCIGTTTFENQYSRGDVYLFEYSKENILR